MSPARNPRWRAIYAKFGRPSELPDHPEICDETGLVVFDDEDTAREAIAALHEEGSPLLTPGACDQLDEDDAEHWHAYPARPPHVPSPRPGSGE